MTETHPLVSASRSIFAGMPAPLLAVISVFLVFVLGADLLLPDFIPFLDEAILAFLLYGSSSALLKRRSGSKDLRPATEGISARSLIKETEAQAKSVVSVAKRLRKGGLPVQALEAMPAVQAKVNSLCDELRRVDTFLSRKENDPWQVQRELEKLERQVAEAEAGGETTRLESLQVAVGGARMHTERVAEQTAARDRIVGRLRTLSSQLGTLGETLDLVNEGDVPRLPESLGVKWEPELAAVLDGLRDVAVATAELDAHAEQETGARPARSRSKNRDLA
ncbi:MAG: hypothetical protein KDA24_04650 [Deltaproteobacteria bacterium]|nr:hypothetical protein [Deltaproteobacteria bacterium]